MRSRSPTIDGPAESPDLLLRPPARGAGVRRLNRVPLLIGIGLAVVIALLIVYTASTRGRSAAHGAVSASENAPAVAATPPEFDAPATGVIPASIVGPTIDPTTGAVQAPPGVDPITTVPVAPPTARDRAPNPYEQDWAHYHQTRQQLAQARGGAMLQALNAASDVQMSRRNAAAPALDAGDPGPASEVMGATPANAPAIGEDNDASFNGQAAKRAFLRARPQDGNASPARRTHLVSPYEIKAGTVIPAVMIGGINSDLPGQIIGQVAEHVYDTKTGQHLLIPQGSKLVGTYDNAVTMGQSRVLVAWTRIIFPDASSFDLNMMPGADQGGYAGFHDKVDNHYGRIFGSALLLSAFSAGIQLSQPQARGFENENEGQTVAGAVGQQLGQTGSEVIRRNLRIQPTLEIRPGYRFNVTVTKDLTVEPLRR